MNQTIISVCRAKSWLSWARMARLYREAFPACERKPFGMLAAMQKKGKTDVWYFEKDGRFVGFASTVNGNGLVMVDYLAVCKKRRGQGIGREMLQALKRIYENTGIFVEIESVYETADNAEERMRRKKFYLSNGIVEMKVMAEVFGVKMELLGWQCQVNFEEYRELYRFYNPMAASHIIEQPYPNE